MSLVPMGDLVGKAYRQGYAVPAFCAWNAEVIEAILGVAQRLRADPAIAVSRIAQYTAR